MSSSRSRAGVLGLLLAVAALPALAAERTPFETVAGWEVERAVGDTSANPCLMTHSYKDADDDDADNAVVFTRDGSSLTIVLGYENWAWDKNEKVRAPFVVGTKVVDPKSAWVGDAELLKGSFPDTVIPNLLGARTIALRLKDAEAEFEIPNFAKGYEALLRCDASQAGRSAGGSGGKAGKAEPERRAAQAPPAAAPLTVSKILFVTRPAGEFGNVAARDSNTFPADEKIRSYLEVTGETIRPGSGGQRGFGLSLDYEVIAADGTIVVGQKAIIDKDFTITEPGEPNVFFDVGLTITGMVPGTYTLAYTLRDKLDGRTATAKQPFTIAGKTAGAGPGMAPADAVRAKAFFVGLMAQRTVRECDFATTATQRAALDAKVASLQPKDPAVDGELRAEVAKGTPACPNTPEMEGKFNDNIAALIAQSPEAYVAAMEKRISEREAAAGGAKP